MRPPQPFGCFDVELRGQWLEAKGDPLSRLDTVSDGDGFRPLLVQALAKPAKGPGGRPANDPVKMFKLLGAQRGDWPDQPDLQPGPLRAPTLDVGAATERRPKNED